MRWKALVLLVFALVCEQSAAQAPSWHVIGRDVSTRLSGRGDVASAQGAELDLRVTMPSKAGFAGAISSIDATPFQGRDVELQGDLRIVDGDAKASLWLRADGPAGRLAFADTGRKPVGAAEGAQARSIHLFIPMATTSLKLGATVKGVGGVEVRGLRLRSAVDTGATSNAYAVLDAALRAAETHALAAERVDWAAERERLLTAELQQANPREAYARFTGILRALGDRHSFLAPPEQAARFQSSATPSQPIHSSSEAGVAYVLVPGVSGSDKKASQQFSRELCQALEALRPGATQGWIIDLRHNPGGNMWPMLAGLQPLLGSDTLGYFQSRSGERSAWQRATIDGCSAPWPKQRVAVLVGPRTASSGEAVAVAFRGRPGTRFFGQPTAGLSSANQPYPLPDGGLLILTTAVFVDRTGQVYPKGIDPDQILRSDEDAVQAARQWLRSSER